MLSPAKSLLKVRRASKTRRMERKEKNGRDMQS